MTDKVERLANYFTLFTTIADAEDALTYKTHPNL